VNQSWTAIIVASNYVKSRVLDFIKNIGVASDEAINMTNMLQQVLDEKAREEDENARLKKEQEQHQVSEKAGKVFFLKCNGQEANFIEMPVSMAPALPIPSAVVNVDNGIAEDMWGVDSGEWRKSNGKIIEESAKPASKTVWRSKTISNANANRANESNYTEKKSDSDNWRRKQ
jgi:hypothetical protein